MFGLPAQACYFVILHENEMMKALLVQSTDPSELNFIAELLKKLGVKSNAISEEELEDLGLSMLLKNVDRSKKSSREAVMKKLKKNAG